MITVYSVKVLVDRYDPLLDTNASTKIYSIYHPLALQMSYGSNNLYGAKVC